MFWGQEGMSVQGGCVRSRPWALGSDRCWSFTGWGWEQLQDLVLGVFCCLVSMCWTFQCVQADLVSWFHAMRSCAQVHSCSHFAHLWFAMGWWEERLSPPLVLPSLVPEAGGYWQREGCCHPALLSLQCWVKVRLWALKH